MDSLMDTLTNVVGILMIILILIQLNVSQAIVKIISEIPPIDVEQFEELELDARAAATRLEERQQQLRDTAENRTELTTVKRELANLQAQLQEQDAELLALETLLEQRRQTRAVLEELRKTARELLAERNRLRELLAEPAPTPPPAVAVSLPSAQPLPARAELETFFLTGGQVYHVNLEAIETAVLAEIGRHRDKFQIREEQQGDRKVPVLDQTKLHQHFEELKMKAGPFDVRIPMNPTRTQVAFRITPIEGEGMEIDGRLLAPYPALLRSLICTAQAASSENRYCTLLTHVACSSDPPALKPRHSPILVSVTIGGTSLSPTRSAPASSSCPARACHARNEASPRGRLDSVAVALASGSRRSPIVCWVSSRTISTSTAPADRGR